MSESQTAYQAIARMAIHLSRSHLHMRKVLVNRCDAFEKATPDDGFFQMFAITIKRGQWLVGAVAPDYNLREQFSYLAAFPYYWEPMFRGGYGSRQFKKLPTMSQQVFSSYFAPQRGILHINNGTIQTPTDSYYAKWFNAPQIEHILSVDELIHALAVTDANIRYADDLHIQFEGCLRSGIEKLQDEYVRLGRTAFNAAVDNHNNYKSLDAKLS
ncbi:MAG TPA: hypothetical protein VK158_04985 [Acidobacteriota bacterium]|nr:hypothetical protein [Acidobacteriota bacterium]